jgi:hypothetical protein
MYDRLLHPRPFRLAALALLAALAACGGRADDVEATPEDVDETTAVEITEQEYAAFRAPRDSVLTPEQVEAYLKTSLLQFDLVRKHSERLHARVQEMEKRAEKGGTIAGLRNLVDAGRTVGEFGDLIGGSYVRSARTLGYNPAEMEWVRERMTEVGAHLAVLPMHDAARKGTEEIRAQAELMRQQLAVAGESALGFSEADIDQMLAAAAEAETQYAQEIQGSRAVQANAAVLHRAKPAVTDVMWTAIGFTGGTAGLLAWGGLSNPEDAELQQKIDEYRRLFTDALANQVTPGMEPSEQ